jgi:HD-like signal output (HDOD) protein
MSEAEFTSMGFTHCESGRALAEKWHLSDDIVQVIAHHDEIERSETVQPLVALVHLADMLCRMRGLGYGYYERKKVDLADNPAWQILARGHRELEE